MKTQAHLTEDQIAIYAEALSSGTEASLPEEWRNHVAECDMCAQEVTAVSQLIDEDEDEDEEVADNNRMDENSAFTLISRKHLVRFGWAASILLIIGAGIFFTIELTDNHQVDIASLEEPKKPSDTLETESSIEVASSAQKKKDASVQPAKNQTAKAEEPQKTENASRVQNVPKDHISEAYTSNGHLEQIAERFDNSNLRNLRGESVSVVSPNKIKVESGGDILIKMNNPDEVSLILEFFNNKGEKLFEKETTKSSYRVKKLSDPGLYYWKLINQDFDLLYCGKIVVEE